MDEHAAVVAERPDNFPQDDWLQEGETVPGVAIARHACDYYDRPLDETTVAVQGYGSVGANAARLLDE